MSPLASSKRLVVKIGSSILVDEAKGEIRHDWLKALTDDVARPDVDASWSDLTQAQRTVVTGFIDNVEFVSARTAFQGKWSALTTTAVNWQAAGVTAPDAAQESFASLSGAQKLVFIEHVGKVLDYASLPEALWTQGTTSTADDVARPGQAAGWSTLSAAQRQVVVAWLDGQLNTSARVTLQGNWASAATANMGWSAAGVATPTTAQTTWASLNGAQLMTLLEHLGYSYDYASIPDASWQGAAGTTDDVSRPLQSQSWSQLSAAQRAVLVRYVDTERSASVTTVPVYVKAYAAEVTVPSDRLIMQGNWANMSSAAALS